MNDIDEKIKFQMLTKFCNAMKADMPQTRVTEDYFALMKPYSAETVDQTFKEWRNDNAFRFPSPNELQTKLIEVSCRAECRGGPKTVRDLFGNLVRVETPLARELRRIFKALMGHPTYINGEVYRMGVITHQEALEMVDEAEARYGPCHGDEIPIRKTPDECLEDAYADISMAIRGQQKHDSHNDHKINEQESDTLKDISRQLLPNGHFIVGAKEKKLIIESFSDDVWRDSYDALQRMGEGI